MFRRLVRLDSFPACRRQTNITPIPKGPPSSSVANYRPNSITSVLSKPLRYLTVWCRFVSDDLWNAMVCFQPQSLLIGKSWVPVLHLCTCPKHCKVHWRVGRRIGSCGLISAESLTREIVKVSEWCDLWGMKLNETKTMIVSRTCTMDPQLHALTIAELC